MVVKRSITSWLLKCFLVLFSSFVTCFVQSRSTERGTHRSRSYDHIVVSSRTWINEVLLGVDECGKRKDEKKQKRFTTSEFAFIGQIVYATFLLASSVDYPFFVRLVVCLFCCPSLVRNYKLQASSYSKGNQIYHYHMNTWTFLVEGFLQGFRHLFSWNKERTLVYVNLFWKMYLRKIRSPFDGISSEFRTNLPLLWFTDMGKHIALPVRSPALSVCQINFISALVIHSFVIKYLCQA